MSLAPNIVDIATTPPQRARLAVSGFFIVHGLVFASWIVRIPDVKAQLQLTDPQLGFALLGAPVGIFVGQVLTGWLLPSWGSRRISILMALGLCACFPLLGLVPTVSFLTLLLVVFGLFSAGMDVGMNVQASLVERQYGRSIMTSFHGWWSVAGMLGASIGSLLLGRGTSSVAHFLGISAAALVGAVVAAPGLLAERQPATESAHTFGLLPRALAPLGVIAFAVLLCEGAIGDWSAIYLREHLGSSPAVAARGYVVFALAMTAGRLMGDELTRRVGPAAIIRGGGVLLLIGLAIILLSPVPWLAILGFGLVGAGIASTFPLVISAAGRTPRIDSGRAIAALATVGYAGGFFGPPLIGALAAVVSLRGALALLGIVGLIMLALGGTAQRREQA
jgi:MFS family permease